MRHGHGRPEASPERAARKRRAPILAAALLAMAGCSTSPMTIGVPGSQIQTPPAPPLKQSSSGEPAFCVASIECRSQITAYNTFAYFSKAPFRDIRLLTDNHPGPQGCDVLLKLKSGLTPWSIGTAQAYSARTRELLWEGSSKGAGYMGEIGLSFLGSAVHRAFQPGQPAYELFAAAKDKGQVPTIDDVEAFASGGLTSESGWFGERQFSAWRFGKARSAEQTAAAPAPVHSATPTAPSRPLSDVDQPPLFSGARRGHAVIVGVERYRGRLPMAEFAASDAKVMARYAHNALGFPEANIALLADETATRGDLVKHFEKWLANRVQKDDEVFVYFSGHGAPDPKTGDAYLVPYDGDPAYLEETAYPLKNLYAALGKLPTGKITVALDSCFSGAGGRSVIAKGSRPLVTHQTDAAPPGMTVIAAARGDQVSNTYEEKGHGLFTYFFLKGLKEKGADLKAVFDYLKPEVADVARREYNADQEPQWRDGR